MKGIFFVISVIFLQAVHAQQAIEFTFSAQSKTTQLQLSEDFSEENVPTISLSSISASNIIITTKNESPKEWKRSFSIDDSDGSTVLDFVPMKKENTFCIKSSQLKELKKGNIYKLYTVAIPADKEKAMLVRVARRLIAKLAIN